jgi:hypothetical protein
MKPGADEFDKSLAQRRKAALAVVGEIKGPFKIQYGGRGTGHANYLN